MNLLLTGKFRRLTVALILFGTLVQADEECSFSKSGMLEHIQDIASGYPGASIDPENLRATWVLENGDFEYYEVGGCYDFGSEVGRATRLSEKRSAEDVLEVAIELGQKYLPKTEVELLSEAIESGSFQKGSVAAEDFIVIDHSLGGEIIISHTYADGSDTVRVSWPANI